MTRTKTDSLLWSLCVLVARMVLVALAVTFLFGNRNRL